MALRACQDDVVEELLCDLTGAEHTELGLGAGVLIGEDKLRPDERLRGIDGLAFTHVSGGAVPLSRARLAHVLRRGKAAWRSRVSDKKRWDDPKGSYKEI